MAIPQAYSDLIYLFLDGEATETERSVLFSALKENPALQEEFASAVEVKSAFVTDALKIQPPTYIEGQIAEKAGLLASKLAGGSAASSALTTAPTAATPFLLKVGLLLLGGAAAGVIATVAINNNSSNNASTADRAARGGAQNMQTVQPAPVTAPMPSSNAQITTSPKTDISANVNSTSATSVGVTSEKTTDAAVSNASSSNVITNTNKPAKDVASNMNRASQKIADLRSNREKNTLPQSNDRSDNQSMNAALHTNASKVSHKHIDEVAKANNNAVAVNTNAADAMTLASSKDISDRSQSAANISNVAAVQTPLVETAMIKQQAANEIVGASDRTRRDLLMPSEDLTADWTHRLSMYGALNTAIAMYPAREVHGADNSGYDRYALGFGYDLGFGSTMNIEFGRETFPIYLKASDGRLQPHYSISYGAIGYQYVLTDVDLLGVHPFARVLAGVATPGPIGKLDAGLTWQSADHFGFTIAPEYTLVAFKNNGSLTTGGKLGVMYQMTYHF